MTAKMKTHGWAIAADRKHYFLNGKSLCGKHRQVSAYLDIAGEGADCCSECKKKRRKFEKMGVFRMEDTGRA